MSYQSKEFASMLYWIIDIIKHMFEENVISVCSVCEYQGKISLQYEYTKGWLWVPIFYLGCEWANKKTLGWCTLVYVVCRWNIQWNQRSFELKKNYITWINGKCWKERVLN